VVLLGDLQELAGVRGGDKHRREEVIQELSRQLQSLRLEVNRSKEDSQTSYSDAVKRSKYEQANTSQTQPNEASTTQTQLNTASTIQTHEAAASSLESTQQYHGQNNLHAAQLTQSYRAAKQLVQLADRNKQLAGSADASEQLVDSAAGSSGGSCPLCRSRDWRQLEGDLWRLEVWLDQAGRKLDQYLSQGTPSSIEALEETIQDHREFLMDLDSHKSMALSINVIGSHLSEHCADSSIAEGLNDRLANINSDWDEVCEKATEWQTRLQTALLENSEFHSTITELQCWLDQTTLVVRESEPIDLSQSTERLTEKYNRFCELQADLHRCEPRVVSLQEAADQLELQADTVSCREVKRKLHLLSTSLRGLIQVCGIYCRNLARGLGLPPPSSAPSTPNTMYDSALVLPSLSTQLLAHREREGDSSNFEQTTSDADLNTGVLTRSYRFLGRVARAALPIQALMLLLLGVSTIVPLEHDELICTLQNNLQRSLEPMLRWSNGPPPI